MSSPYLAANLELSISMIPPMSFVSMYFILLEFFTKETVSLPGVLNILLFIFDSDSISASLPLHIGFNNSCPCKTNNQVTFPPNSRTIDIVKIIFFYNLVLLGAVNVR